MSKVDDGLRPLFRKHLRRGCQWTTIESGFTERGIPDSYFCMIDDRVKRTIKGSTGWIEMKATKGWDVTLRPEQCGWLTTHARHGGQCFVAVRRRVEAGPRRGDACDELWLFDGASADELKAHGFRQCAEPSPNTMQLPPGTLLGNWSGGPGGWDWDAVREILIRGY